MQNTPMLFWDNPDFNIPDECGCSPPPDILMERRSGNGEEQKT